MCLAVQRYKPLDISDISIVLIAHVKMMQVPLFTQQLSRHEVSIVMRLLAGYPERLPSRGHPEVSLLLLCHASLPEPNHHRRLI